MDVQHARRRESAHQRLANASRISARFARKHQRLGDGFDRERDNDLIGNFSGLAVTVAAY
jgi:hypothetical protein